MKTYLVNEELLRQVLDAIHTDHYYCEDNWYCCPAHEEALNERRGECECGAEDRRAVKEALRTLLAKEPSEPETEAIYAAWHGAGVDIVGGNWNKFITALPHLYRKDTP